MILLKKHSKWISSEEIEVLKHNLNYSNWTDTYACEGKWKIDVTVTNTKIDKVSIYMPTARWGEKHSGYWTIYSGRAEIVGRELLIWQNEEVPARLNFREVGNHIFIHIYGRSIEFKME